MNLVVILCDLEGPEETSKEPSQDGTKEQALNGTQEPTKCYFCIRSCQKPMEIQNCTTHESYTRACVMQQIFFRKYNNCTLTVLVIELLLGGRVDEARRCVTTREFHQQFCVNSTKEKCYICYTDLCNSVGILTRGSSPKMHSLSYTLYGLPLAIILIKFHY
ncbi:hypothetical protein Zmor_004747 [Zophobas morio]|uniref:Uncharacterized protein n=1 Tax=Zophobas morio TaxID=2755281 RepID=A0AA38MLK2_9CUCU|nr:hypothetical protein Zmor_004747 [Zophobas morio]